MTLNVGHGVPPLLGRGIDFGLTHAPPIPDTAPSAVCADPGWQRQWEMRRTLLMEDEFEPLESFSAKRRRDLARYLAVMGHMEFELITVGCSYAARSYELPTSWRMCILKQGYDDMQHAASFIARGSQIADEDYWRGIDVPYGEGVTARRAILERDLGGFFVVIGLHTEAYPAWTNTPALMLDPVLRRWTLHEIEEEAQHLEFLFPAMRDFLGSGTLEEQDAKKRQFVADDEHLVETLVNTSHRNAQDFVVSRLGLSPDVLWGFEHFDQRRRYVYNVLGIEHAYWPAHLVRQIGTGDEPGRVEGD